MRAQGTVRAGVDKPGYGTCPLIARHVPELFKVGVWLNR